jgi:hypothetical protein
MNDVRKAWTDERLDDLALRVDKGFDRVDADLRELRSGLNGRMDAMQRTMILGFGTVIASVIATQL